METATFGAGCFWGVEAAFRQVPGVIATAVGYTGGEVAAPSYEEVCAGHTGHTEAVEVVFDPARVSFAELLDVFWRMHDATQAEKTQYASIIFYHSPAQRADAEAGRAGRIGLGQPIRTELRPAGKFYRAEEYHQRYYEKHGIRDGACGA